MPGVDSYLGAGVSDSLMRFSEQDSGDVASRQPDEVGDIELIREQAPTLNDKFRQLCYWRQVVNAESN
ncbi:MAG TPA: hypothetical protein VN816_08475 [Acidimicrobiales bacterium]|nr:hypothetical protein [Acidimicrobiales bacterium]